MCFQFTHLSCDDWENIYILCLIIIIKSEVWTITRCLGSGHETMECAVCLSTFFWITFPRSFLKISDDISDDIYRHFDDHILLGYHIYKYHSINIPQPWFYILAAARTNVSQGQRVLTYFQVHVLIYQGCNYCCQFDKTWRQISSGAINRIKDSLRMLDISLCLLPVWIFLCKRWYYPLIFIIKTSTLL